MERLGDDMLLYIFNKMEDKRLFAQVSKRFTKIACIGLYRLNNCFPDLLLDILPLSPNLRSFHCYKQLSNTHLKLLAQSCPKLQSLKLGKNLDPSSDPGEFDHDFDDDGLCDVVKACSHLRKVNLSRRLHIGDSGIVFLVTSCKSLIKLNLEGCVRVTDESLKAIGKSSICELSLGGCSLVTDLGLECLANGNVKNSLHTLSLSECDGISNNGIRQLSQIVGLIELKVLKCGVRVTKFGVLTMISKLPNIVRFSLD